MATSLTFTGTIFTSASLLLSASQLTPLVIAQGGPNGSRVYGLAISMNSTAATHVLGLSSSAGITRLSAVSVTANSGFTTTAPQFDFFANSQLAASFQKNKDANGVPYFNLAPNTFLTMNTSASFLASSTTSSIVTFGEFY